MAAEDEIRLHHLVGIGKRLIDGAGVEIALEGEVVAERRMDHRRRRIERGAHVGHRVEFFIFDRDDFGRIFRDRAARRHDGGDRLALPADTVNGDGAVAARISGPSDATARRPMA